MIRLEEESAPKWALRDFLRDEDTRALTFAIFVSGERLLVGQIVFGMNMSRRVGRVEMGGSHSTNQGPPETPP